MQRFRTIDRQTGETTRYIEFDQTDGSGMVYYVDHRRNESVRSTDGPMGLYSPSDLSQRIEQWTQQDGQRIVQGW